MKTVMIHRLYLLVDWSKNSLCVWSQTLTACEMATIFQPSLLEDFTGVGILILPDLQLADLWFVFFEFSE